MNYLTAITQARNIFVLTGAGVSTEAGIPDFQTTDENWPYELTREEIMSRPFFNQNPTEFWKAYRTVFSTKFQELQPTSFHYWLAELEQSKTVTITTQNVDGLHSKAGSTEVIEAHGNISRVICTRPSCQQIFARALFEQVELPRCLVCNKPLKPDISLFYEGITGYMDSMERISEADLVIVAGTSLKVGPINELPLQAELRYKKPLLWVNKQLPPPDYNFDYMFTGNLEDFVQSVR